MYTIKGEATLSTVFSLAIIICNDYNNLYISTIVTV